MEIYAVLVLIMFLGVPFITAYIAHRKGYNPIIWFFAGSFLGLIALALLPNVKKKESNHYKELSYIRDGNIIGTVLLLLNLAFFAYRVVKTHNEIEERYQTEKQYMQYPSY